MMWWRWSSVSGWSHVGQIGSGADCRGLPRLHKQFLQNIRVAFGLRLAKFGLHFGQFFFVLRDAFVEVGYLSAEGVEGVARFFHFRPLQFGGAQFFLRLEQFPLPSC